MVSSSIILCCIVVAFAFLQAGTVQVADQASAMQTVDNAKPTTSWIKDKGDMICFEGETDYVKDVLRRLLESNLQTGFQDAIVTKGQCDDHNAGFPKKAPSSFGASFNKLVRWQEEMLECFPGLLLRYDRCIPSCHAYIKNLDKLQIDYMAEFNELHPDQANQTKVTLKCDE